MNTLAYICQSKSDAVFMTISTTIMLKRPALTFGHARLASASAPSLNEEFQVVSSLQGVCHVGLQQRAVKDVFARFPSVQTPLNEETSKTSQKPSVHEITQ